MAVSVRLDLDIDRRLRVLARELSCSHHYMMCEAIRRFVEDEEARLRGEKPVAAPAGDFSLDQGADAPAHRWRSDA